MTFVTVLVTARARWRGALLWVVVADALVLISAVVISAVVADQAGGHSGAMATWKQEIAGTSAPAGEVDD